MSAPYGSVVQPLSLKVGINAGYPSKIVSDLSFWTGVGFGASMIDLLNQPINERALETLLAGDWQVGLSQV